VIFFFSFFFFFNFDFGRHTHSHGSESKKTRQRSAPGSGGQRCPSLAGAGCGQLPGDPRLRRSLPGGARGWMGAGEAAPQLRGAAKTQQDGDEPKPKTNLALGRGGRTHPHPEPPEVGKGRDRRGWSTPHGGPGRVPTPAACPRFRHGVGGPGAPAPAPTPPCRCRHPISRGASPPRDRRPPRTELQTANPA